MLSSFFKRTVTSKVRRFLRSESGMTLPFLAGSLVILMGFTGIAIDMARLQMVQAKLQFAVDSAGLAAGAKVSTADADVEFKKYLEANFNGYMGSTLTTSALQANPSNTIFNLTATASMPTTFMAVMGVHSVTLAASSEVSRAVSGLELIFVLDNTGSMTSSAGGYNTKLSALKLAATTLINQLFGASDYSTNDKLFIGIVPFGQTVNIGSSHTEWINPNYAYDNAKTATGDALPEPYSDNLDWGTTRWHGCVDARLPNKDITDDPPNDSDTSTLFGKFYWTSDNLNPNTASSSNSWHLYGEHVWKWKRCDLNLQNCESSWKYTCTEDATHRCKRNASMTKGYVKTCQTPYSTVYNETGEYCTLSSDAHSYSISGTSKGPNISCPQPITEMTDAAPTLRTAIDAMEGTGATNIAQGLQWGWFMLSPRWRGEWGGLMATKGLPLDYHTTGMAKAIVLLTDGVNTTYTTTHGAYWFPKDNRMGTTYPTLDAKTAKLCRDMKQDENIVIYTIALGTDDMNLSLLRNCATDEGHAFVSPSTSDLQNVFKEIGDSLSNLRVSH